MEFKILLLIGFFVCCQLNCAYLKAKKQENPSPSVVYSGGNGESFQEAVIITGVKSKGELINAEYEFISKKYGTRGKGWLLVGQTLIQEKNRVFDVIEILVYGLNGEKILYFDVTDFMLDKNK
ncbi:MAG: hypothetical protein N2053_04485 [Chitinispirillaceae bacterium]|nr:hypothetical protein [Chitinispirillaceae bacterium]